MSRIGKKPVKVPANTKVVINGLKVMAEGPKGKLEYTMPPKFKAELKDGWITVIRPSDVKQDMAYHGLARSYINNILKGVTDGYSKNLEIQGVGFKAQLQGKTLIMNLGFTHPINFQIPDGITIKTPKPTEVVVEGIDKQKVGQVAADIRSYYIPEPYKGKGVRYSGEYVRKKAGKAVA